MGWVGVGVGVGVRVRFGFARAAPPVPNSVAIAPHAAFARQATAPVQELVRVRLGFRGRVKVRVREYGAEVWFGCLTRARVPNQSPSPNPRPNPRPRALILALIRGP